MRSKKKSAKSAKGSQPKTIKLADLANVRCNETANGEKLVRFTMKNGTWVELVCTGIAASGVNIESIDKVQSSFDFKKKKVVVDKKSFLKA